MLTASEHAALAVFRSFMVNTGEMLCFHGPQLEKHGATLRTLAEKNLVVKEQFAGGYSLTRAGFEAMSVPAGNPPSAGSPAKSPAAANKVAANKVVATAAAKSSAAKRPVRQSPAASSRKPAAPSPSARRR
jgi:hypothetical protein